MRRKTIRAWPGYAAFWRWHFYAGLLCIPFVLWLACTGGIYLWKPQVEAFLDRPYAHLPMTEHRASAAAQAEAAVKAVPGSILHRYQLPESSDEAVQIIVGKDRHETRVYVHPETLAILKRVDEDSRLMPTIFRLHGELMIGNPGSYIVELAASWAIIMILSGLVLWWPRGRGGMAGVLYPRLYSPGRIFWRDLHGVTGFWVSFFALFLLISGLPWAKSWGSYLKAVRSVAEGRVTPQDWSSGTADLLKQRSAMDHGTRLMLGEHEDHKGMQMDHMVMSYAPLDRLIATVRPLKLAYPVLIAPPTTMHSPWTARSDAANRPLRTTLTLDGKTGAILTREDFAQRRLVDRLVGYGVAAHEGQLFGLANQIIGLLTALGLILISISSVILWWRRKPADQLGAPPRIAAPVAIGFLGLIVAMGILLPLFGASLILVLVAERLVLRRSPKVRRWLGLEDRL